MIQELLNPEQRIFGKPYPGDPTDKSFYSPSRVLDPKYPNDLNVPPAIDPNYLKELSREANRGNLRPNGKWKQYLELQKRILNRNNDVCNQ
jgi:hypothetical protein